MIGRAGAAIAVALLVASGCAGGDVDRAAEAELLAADYDVPVATGRCVIDLVVDAMGEDRYDAVAEGAEPTTGEVGLLFDAFETCGIEVDQLFDADDVEDIAASFGLAEDEARCVVELAVDRRGAERLAELAAASPDGAEQDALLAIVGECTE